MKRDSRKETIEGPGEPVKANLAFKIIAKIRRPLVKNIRNMLDSASRHYCMALDKGVEEEVYMKVFSPVAGATIDELVNYESR